MKKNHTLTKQDSAALKGIAILLMIFHHCFLDPSRFAGHIVSFAPFSQSAIVSLSYFSKICVGIFAFISGYGLYLSAVKQPRSAKAVSGWTVSRLIKTMSGYWLLYFSADYHLDLCGPAGQNLLYQRQYPWSALWRTGLFGRGQPV